MKIALIIYGSIDTITGGTIYNKKLVEYLIKQGIEIKIISQPYRSFISRIKNNFSPNIVNEINEFTPDVILQDAMNFLSLFILNKKIKKKITCPIISIIHLLPSCVENNSIIKFFIKTIEKRYFNLIDGMIFNSKATQQAVQQVTNKITKSYIIAYPGKDRIDSFRELTNKITPKKRNSSTQLKIIFIGQVTPNKGLHLLIKALNKIELKFWQLSVIGNETADKKYINKIKKFIKRNHLDLKMDFLGILPPEKLWKQINQHDILAVPSYYESFGLVYVEAMGAGLPVIATQAGGSSEFVIDHKNGFLIKPGDSEMIQTAIFKLIQNQNLLSTMSLNALLTYQQLPFWNDSLYKIHQFLIAYHTRAGSFLK